MDAIHIVWFKRDLRLIDHAPLCAAAARGTVLPLYVYEPDLWAQPDASARQYAVIQAGLADLREALTVFGAPLVIRQGDVLEVLAALRQQYTIAGLYSHEESGNAWTYQRDRRVAAWCRSQGIAWHEFRQFGVVRGLQARRAWATQWEAQMAPAPLPAPLEWHSVQGIEPGAIPQLPVDPAWQGGGRRAGLRLLQSFLGARGARYHREMSSPVSAESACSRLSVHLCSGSLSLREVLHAVRARREALREADDPAAAVQRRALSAFDARLHWHCHFIQKLESEPEIEFRNMQRGYDGMREQDVDPARLAAWCAGETGWPFVDACMRMLQATGWINFRMRAMLMAVASYHLWLHWRPTGLHLARCFSDYEPGIHWSQCQMQSGVTGINIPRIYNPIKQSRDQDPEGLFIRRWLPQLAGVSSEWIHEPWRMSAALQRQSGCVLGRDYPAPITDHLQAAREAKARLTAWRRRPGMSEGNRAVLIKHGSRKRDVRVRTPPVSAQPDLFGEPG